MSNMKKAILMGGIFWVSLGVIYALLLSLGLVLSRL